MVCVERAYARSTSAFFLHLTPRQRCRDHPVAMFNGLAVAAFVWTLVPTESSLGPLSVSMDHAGSVQILGSTGKTSRLPRRDVIRNCPEQDRGSDWLECLTAIAQEGGKVGTFLG